ARRLPPITRATFDNGLRVLIVEYHELPLVEFHLIVGAGAAQDPPGKGGLAALTAGTLTRGTGKLSADELARAIESLGGRITATPGTDGTILVRVGDLVAAEPTVRLREAFGAWRPRPDALAVRAAPPSRLPARRVLLVDKPDATQTQIRLGNVAIARNDPAYVPAVVANTILGGGFTSQLIEELRIKRSLTYSAWSMFATRLAGGDFRLGTFTKTPTTTETLALALSVEGEFRSHAPARERLAKAKTYLRGQFPLRIESPDALAARLAEAEFNALGPEELATYRARVAAVTPEQAAEVAGKLMPPPEAVAIVVVGKEADIADGLAAGRGRRESIAARDGETLSVA